MNSRVSRKGCLFLMIFSTVSFGLMGYFPNLSHMQQHSANRGTSYPYLSPDTFRHICKFVVDEATLSWPLENSRLPFNPKDVQPGDLIFINFRTKKGGLMIAGEPHFGEYFFDRIHPLIDVPYILVTHHDDSSAPGDFAQYLDDAKIIAWFGLNIDMHHPKLFPLPYGLANKYWPHGNTAVIDRVVNNAKSVRKDILLYINLSIDTNPPIRQRAVNLLAGKSFVTYTGRKDYESYMNELARSKFALSPVGNGLDVIKTWEALLVGSIPIVLSTTLNDVYDGLPVVIVKNYEEVTEEFLVRTYEEMQKKTYSLERIYADYWLNKIYTCQKQYIEQKKGEK